MILEEPESRSTGQQNQEPHIPAQELAHGDGDPGGEGQLSPQSLEKGREGGNDLPEDDDHHPHGDGDDRGGIDHGGANGRLQFDPLFNVGRHPLENGIQDAARLSRGNHVAEKIIEYLRVLAQGVCQSGTRLHVLADPKQDLLEGPILLLAA